MAFTVENLKKMIECERASKARAERMARDSADRIAIYEAELAALPPAPVRLRAEAFGNGNCGIYAGDAKGGGFFAVTYGHSCYADGINQEKLNAHILTFGQPDPNAADIPLGDVDKRAAGLYRKFNVTRTDGKSASGEKHHNCKYFVLDIDHDKYAQSALVAYANACASEYPALAEDLRSECAAMPTQPDPNAAALAAADALADAVDDEPDFSAIFPRIHNALTAYLKAREVQQ